jgi:8-oxo-dGTP pyrophosphatase MutT (NUDIX family)
MGDYVAELRTLVGHRPLLLAAAGVIVRDRAGQILLQRRVDDDRWGIPGGALELGESLEEAARRELAEETGLIAGELELLDVYSGAEFFLTYANGDQAYIVGATYLATNVSSEPTPDGGEGKELRYFPTSALPATLNDYNRRLLERCLPQLTAHADR